MSSAGSGTTRSGSSRNPNGSAPSTSAPRSGRPCGWGTILYLAALTTIDEDLYEAARIDGANRWRQIWHVTLPGIRPTMITLLILNIGTFLAVGFEKVLLLYNPLTYPTADVISTYLYRTGVESNSFSYAAAIGLFEAVIGLVLITSANQLSRRTVGTSLW